MKNRPEPIEIHVGSAKILVREILIFGQPHVVACDAQCHKAWGITERPRQQLSDDEDDYEFLSDDELGQAPESPNMSEGGEMKPVLPEHRLNKWCTRQCERSEVEEKGKAIHLQDFSRRLKNIGD